MYFNNSPLKESMQKFCFRPPLWFAKKYEKRNFEDNFAYFSFIEENEDFEQLSLDEKLKILQNFNFNVSNTKKRVNYEEKERFTTVKMLNKFIKNNYDYKRANHKLFEALAYLGLSRDYFYSDSSEQYSKMFEYINEYYHKYDVPFKWYSSQTLYSSVYPIFYTTFSLREHIIFLAWRVVMICLNNIMHEVNYSDSFSTAIQHCHKKLSLNPNIKKYKKIKSNLFFSLFILNQLIPCQMRQLSGDLKNQSTTSGAIIVPELNPYVVSAFSKFVVAVMQQSFFINIVSHLTYKNATKDVTINNIMKILNFKNQLSLNTSKQIDLIELKEIYIGSIDNFINILYENELTITLLSGLFKIYHSCFEDMKNHCWNYQLENPYHDLIYPNDKNIFTSNISKFYYEQYIERFNNEKKKEKVLIDIMKQTNYAVNMKNLLIGSMLYIECLLTFYHISSLDFDDFTAFAKIVNVAKKVELLLLPIFDKNELAIEMICWLLNQVKIRSSFCPDISALFEEENCDKYFKSGEKYTFIYFFTSKKFKILSKIEDTLSKNFSSISGFFSSMFKAKSQIPSDLVESEFSNLKKKKTDDNIAATSSAASNPKDEKKIIIPFDKEDLFNWVVLCGLYPLINDSKSNIFPKIELNIFYHFPSNLFIPDSFYTDYYDQIRKWVTVLNKFKDSIKEN